jgi:hypothetical protein
MFTGLIAARIVFAPIAAVAQSTGAPSDITALKEIVATQ